MVPTYDIGASIDYLLKYARDARWDVVGRAMEVLEGSFVKKMNDDGWHTFLQLVSIVTLLFMIVMLMLVNSPSASSVS